MVWVGGRAQKPKIPFGEEEAEGEYRSRRCPSLGGGRCIVNSGGEFGCVVLYIYRSPNKSNNKPFIYTSVISLDQSNHS